MLRTPCQNLSRWQLGLWLGKDTEANDTIVGTSTGCFKSRSIRRLPKDQQFQQTALNDMKGLPWDPTATGQLDENFVVSEETVKQLRVQLAVNKETPTTTT